MKKVIALFFLLCEIVFADCLLYESEAFANEAVDFDGIACIEYAKR